MATACVVSPVADIRDVPCHQQRIQMLSRTGLDDDQRFIEEGAVDICTRTTRRCDSANIGCCLSAPTSRSALSTSPTHLKAYALVAELLLSIPGPSKRRTDNSSSEDCYTVVAQPRPDTKCLAHARSEAAKSAPPISDTRAIKGGEGGLLGDPLMGDLLNLGDATGMQTRGGKNAKKAAKKAQQAKWEESDNEDAAKNGEGESNGGGGGEGGGNGAGGAGAGGNGDGGGGGDEGDDWDTGGKKNKKNKKKAKQEEEEKKAQEEEERKRKEEEEEETQAAAANSLSWANEPNDTNADDEWAGLTGTKGKKKKGKKAAEEVALAAPEPPNTAFHEISLEDTTPNLDFSFGGIDTKKSTSIGGLGTWGNTWEFGSVSAGTTGEKKGDKAVKPEAEKGMKDSTTELGDNNPWSSGNKSKNKKKTNMTSDFDFGGFGAAQEVTDIDLGLNGPTDVKPVGEDSWGFSSVNKKDKKKKGKDTGGEKMEDTVTALPEPEKEKETDYSLGVWGTGKKDKKKNKKDTGEDTTNAFPSGPGKPAHEGDDEWASFDFGKKDKKKTAKGAVEESIPEEADPPAPEPQFSFDWAQPTSKKDKKDKKNKKNGLVNEAEDDPIVAIEDAATGDITATGDGSWMNSAWTTGNKKKDKKGAKGTATESAGPPESTALADTNTTGDGDWMNSAWSSDSKKKDKKGTAAESTDPLEPTTVADTNTTTWNAVVEDDDWTVGTKKSKKDKKGKKADSNPADVLPVPPLQPPIPPPAPETVEESDTWGLFGTKDKKNGKKGKIASSEPTIQDTEPVLKEAEEAKEESTWGSWGLPAKDKKKKEKEVKKKGTAERIVEVPIVPVEDVVPPEETLPEDDIWGSWGGLGQKKNNKKVKDAPPPPAPTPPAQGLTPEPGPAAMPEFEDDSWKELTGELTTTKSKSSAKKGTLSRSTTMTGKSLKSDDAKAKIKEEEEQVDSNGSPKVEKALSKKDVAKAETPAKAAKGIWGSFGGTTNSAAKTKLAKEKEKREEEERVRKEEAEAAALEEAEAAAAREEAEAAAREEAEVAAREEAEAAALAALAAPGKDSKKTTKSKTTGKASKADAKAAGKADEKKKKADEVALIDILDEPSPEEEKASSKLKKSDAKAANDKKDKEAEKEEEKKSDDYFGFWGSSKKTAGKKDAETKKEIDNQGWANESDALASFPNGLEESVADEPSPPIIKPSKTMSTTAPKSKPTASSSVAARIKALEANKKEDKAEKLRAEQQLAKDLENPPPPPPPPVEESLKETKKKGVTTNSKTASASTSKPSKKKEPSPPVEEKKPKETVPGSFPGAFGDDDDLMALDDFPAAPEIQPAKKVKDNKKATPKSKMVKMEDILVEAPEAPEPPEPPKLPTPPPEEKKPAKKERARVERTGASSSWGFWGAAPTPKKDSAKKESPANVEEEAVTPSPKKKTASPGFTRSKSTKTAKEKERDDKKETEKTSKSSGSDTKEKRPEAKQSKSNRGMSFSAFMMGGPPPSATRAKPTRRSSVTGGSRPTSRRQSMDIGAGGLMSPPPDDQLPIADKAAKLMGVKGTKLERTKTAKGKERASVVPDPYPIDDDDLVMVNGLEDPLLNGASSKNPPPKEKMAKTKSKRESKATKPRARTLSNDDDVVMVEAGPSGGEPFVASGPDDMAFMEHNPPELKRSNTTTKKTGGFFGGFFGGGGKAEKTPEPAARSRPNSFYREERMIDAEPLPTRTKEKSKRRSMKPYAVDSDLQNQAEPDRELEVRRVERHAARNLEEQERAERRKSQRDKEKAELEARRTKARDRARKEREAEEQRREEKRNRRAAREEARLREEEEVEAAAIARRDERRRLRAELEASELEKARVAAEGEEGVEKIRKSAKEDRKKQFEREEEERLQRREEKKRKSSTRDKEKSGTAGKRKSTATSPLMDEYFESRNGNNGQKQPGGPSEKTRSWVNSQASDPPDLPPVEGTILDGEKPRSAALFGEDLEGLTRGDEPRRSSKREKDSSRRRSKHVTSPEPEEQRRSSRRKESRRTAAEREEVGAAVKSGSGSGGDGAAYTSKHRSSRRRDTEYDAYADGGPAVGGIKTFDGRPALGNKRNSILGRLGGFL